MSIITWLIIAAVLIVLEIITVSLTSIWFAIGAFAAALVTTATDHLGIQLGIFIAISIILWIFTRPIAMKHLKLGRLKTNVESLVGQQAIVTETINNIEAKGHAKINGLEWTARSEGNTIINEGAIVVIKEVSGVKLIVEAIPQQ